jgi:hypothetical protein
MAKVEYTGREPWDLSTDPLFKEYQKVTARKAELEENFKSIARQYSEAMGYEVHLPGAPGTSGSNVPSYSNYGTLGYEPSGNAIAIKDLQVGQKIPCGEFDGVKGVWLFFRRWFTDLNLPPVSVAVTGGTEQLSSLFNSATFKLLDFDNLTDEFISNNTENFFGSSGAYYGQSGVRQGQNLTIATGSMTALTGQSSTGEPIMWKPATTYDGRASVSALGYVGFSQNYVFIPITGLVYSRHENCVAFGGITSPTLISDSENYRSGYYHQEAWDWIFGNIAIGQRFSDNPWLIPEGVD